MRNRMFGIEWGRAQVVSSLQDAGVPGGLHRGGPGRGAASVAREGWCNCSARRKVPGSADIGFQPFPSPNLFHHHIHHTKSNPSSHPPIARLLLFLLHPIPRIARFFFLSRFGNAHISQSIPHASATKKRCFHVYPLSSNAGQASSNIF